MAAMTPGGDIAIEVIFASSRSHLVFTLCLSAYLCEAEGSKRGGKVRNESGGPPGSCTARVGLTQIFRVA